MKQYTFLSEEDFIKEVDELAEKESRSRSVMIDLLLHQAVKERSRKKNAKRKDNTEPNAFNLGKGNAKGQNIL
jgi:predicted transcriptional regulator